MYNGNVCYFYFGNIYTNGYSSRTNKMRKSKNRSTIIKILLYFDNFLLFKNDHFLFNKLTICFTCLPKCVPFSRQKKWNYILHLYSIQKRSHKLNQTTKFHILKLKFYFSKEMNANSFPKIVKSVEYANFNPHFQLKKSSGNSWSH